MIASENHGHSFAVRASHRRDAAVRAVTNNALQKTTTERFRERRSSA
jgi:hypothetical protein